MVINSFDTITIDKKCNNQHLVPNVWAELHGQSTVSLQFLSHPNFLAFVHSVPATRFKYQSTVGRSYLGPSLPLCGSQQRDHSGNMGAVERMM